VADKESPETENIGEVFKQEFQALESGISYAFREWPNKNVPKTHGIYTIYENSRLLYVGVADKLYERLKSHASGRRSGDQFCIYVCDRMILITLTKDEILKVADGKLCLDKFTRQYIRSNLSYRFVETASENMSPLEIKIKSGALSIGKPLLNPL
jgi:hypothetical protein